MFLLDRSTGADRVLDLLVEALPSPLEAPPRMLTGADGSPVEVACAEDGPAVVYCFKTLADQFSGRINLLRNFSGVLPSDSQATGTGGTKERVGQLFTLLGKDHQGLTAIGPGDIGAVAKLKELCTGHMLVTGGQVPSMAGVTLPPAVMSFAVTAADGGDEDKLYQSLRRLCDEDPTLDVHRDEQTGDLIVGGLSQLHVEVTGERLMRRFGVGFELHPPHVPYRETITASAKAEGKHKKQTGGRGQFGDCEIVLEPIAGHEGYEFVDKIVGGVIPQGYRPAVDKGIQEAMQHGELAGAPVQGIRVSLVDGQYHNVDSSEMAFKIAGSMAFKEAYAKADPVLLEPIMELEAVVPDDAVGAVNGDLNSRRGRLHGMEPAAGMTTIKAEVPMSELLTYAQSLTSMTSGRGDYSMHLLRYDEVPSHVAQKIIDETRKAREAAGA